MIKSEKYKNKKIIVGSNYLCDVIKMKNEKKDKRKLKELKIHNYDDIYNHPYKSA